MLFLVLFTYFLLLHQPEAPALKMKRRLQIGTNYYNIPLEQSIRGFTHNISMENARVLRKTSLDESGTAVFAIDWCLPDMPPTAAVTYPQ